VKLFSFGSQMNMKVFKYSGVNPLWVCDYSNRLINIDKIVEILVQ
jgi:hypothetical protein